MCNVRIAPGTIRWFCSTGSTSIIVCYCDTAVLFHVLFLRVGNMLLLTTVINMRKAGVINMSKA